MITTETLPRTTSGTTTARPRHIVELAPDGEPADKALCGYVWDRLHVGHNGEVCQECVDEQRRRHAK